MWTWDFELHASGFRRRSPGYWKAERCLGLPDDAYASIFCDELAPGARRSRSRLIEFAAFHVTFCAGGHRLHFYYHEIDQGLWEPGGYTSRQEIELVGQDPLALRHLADDVAGRFVAALGARLVPRGSL